MKWNCSVYIMLLLYSAFLKVEEYSLTRDNRAVLDLPYANRAGLVTKLSSTPLLLMALWNEDGRTRWTEPRDRRQIPYHGHSTLPVAGL